MSEAHLGKYRLLGLLATGGMGEVFLARQEGPKGFAKRVVVKRVLAHLAREPGFVEMFLDEARLAALLTHPNVVQIFELGEEAGTYFIAMEYVHGKSLRAIRQTAAHRKEKVAPGFVAAVIPQALWGLDYAHQLTEEGKPLGLVHRDVSPDNVMVGFDGQVKVLDFGIAKASTAITTTRTGTVKGKFAYMAPEQLLAEPLDGRADIYAAGILMYELLAGVRPFTAPTDPALVHVVLHTEAPPLWEKAPGVPKELAQLVMKAMAKSREERWSSAEELARALEAWVHSTGDDWTHATTRARYLTGLFGGEVPEQPIVITPSGSHRVPTPSAPLMPPVPSPVPSIDVDLSATRTATPSALRDQPPAKRGRFTWLVLLLLPVPLAVMATVFVMRPSPHPEPVRVNELPLAIDAGIAEKKAEPVIDAGAVAITEPPPPAAPDAGKAAVAVRARGRIELRINPWGEVFENGKSLGVTPMPPLELPAGPHTFVITNSELKTKTTRSVNLLPNRTQVLRVELLE